MDSKISKTNILSGFIWSFGERILAQIVSLVVGVVLARILSPNDYGVISIVMIFITICNVFVTSSFGTAIVRQEKASSIDFDTAFILSFLMASLLYIVIFFASPFIADFYAMPVLKPIMRVFGMRIIISAINNIQQAYIQRQMKFKKFFIATLYGTIISCIVGIFMAYQGFGVWALVAQYMTNTTIDTVALFIVGGWRPHFQFSQSSAKSIFSFGWKMLCSQLVYTLSNDLRSLIIGKVFGASDLAYYEQGKKYPAVIVDNIDVAIAKVMLPTFARAQTDFCQLKQLLRKSIRIGVFIVAPIMCGFAAVSNSFVNLILTDKWLPAVPYIQILCIAYITRPLEELCHRVTLAIGKSGAVMIIMIIINSVSLLLTVVATFILKSVLWIALFYLLHTLISLICFMFITNRYLHYCVKEQVSDTVPIIGVSVFMAIIVKMIGMIKINPLLSLLVQIIVGVGVYCFISKILKIKEYSMLKSMVIGYCLHREVL